MYELQWDLMVVLRAAPNSRYLAEQE